jgi:hypothetical protein
MSSERTQRDLLKEALKSDLDQNRRWNFQETNTQNSKFARKKLWGKNCASDLQGMSFGRTHKELLKEALKSDLDQYRRWNFQETNTQNSKFVRKKLLGKNCAYDLHGMSSERTRKDLLNEVLISHRAHTEILTKKIPCVLS